MLHFHLLGHFRTEASQHTNTFVFSSRGLIQVYVFPLHRNQSVEMCLEAISQTEYPKSWPGIHSRRRGQEQSSCGWTPWNIWICLAHLHNFSLASSNGRDLQELK